MRTQRCRQRRRRRRRLRRRLSQRPSEAPRRTVWLRLRGFELRRRHRDAARAGLRRSLPARPAQDGAWAVRLWRTRRRLRRRRCVKAMPCRRPPRMFSRGLCQPPHASPTGACATVAVLCLAATLMLMLMLLCLAPPGVKNCLDACKHDVAKVAPGACGCGTVDTDSDGDGTADCIDLCPRDPLKVAPGHCGCGTPDGDAASGSAGACGACRRDPTKDSDNDGAKDCEDECPDDASSRVAGPCGCGASHEVRQRLGGAGPSRRLSPSPGPDAFSLRPVPPPYAVTTHM